jgi:magnesium chelatase family protein
VAQSRAEVAAARARAAARWNRSVPGPAFTNASVPHEVLHALPETAGVSVRVRQAQKAGVLSRRGGDSVTRLAWTLADLAGADEPGRDHVVQALTLRNGTDPGLTGSEVR